MSDKRKESFPFLGRYKCYLKERISDFMKCAFLEGYHDQKELAAIVENINAAIGEVRAIIGRKKGNLYLFENPSEFAGQHSRKQLETLIQRHGIKWCAIM